MKTGVPLLQSTRLLDQVRERVRYLHYRLKTEKAYLCIGSVFHSLERCAKRGHAASARHGGDGGGSIFAHAGQ